MGKWIIYILLLVVLVGGLLWKLSSNGIKTIEDSVHPVQEFAENQGAQPIFLEFTSDQCPSCQKMKPIIAELEKQYGNKVKFIIANVSKNDEAVSLARNYSIQGVPTILILNEKGELVESFIGLTKKIELEEILNKL